jgi:hypothetical protein
LQVRYERRADILGLVQLVCALISLFGCALDFRI